MLRHIPPVLSPDLVKMLMEMGHGDEITLADANFPGHGLHHNVVRADGVLMTPLLEAVLALMPLDRYSDWQVTLMRPVPNEPVPPIWRTYESVWTQAEGAHGPVSTRFLDRADFYEAVRRGFGVVLTGETALYGNIILKKGVL